LKIDSQAEFRCFEKGSRIGGAFKEDERPTSNIQRPTSNEKTDLEAGGKGQGAGSWA
jgi:hypothetical protein